jgi:hypothetical protein
MAVVWCGAHHTARHQCTSASRSTGALQKTATQFGEQRPSTPAVMPCLTLKKGQCLYMSCRVPNWPAAMASVSASPIPSHTGRWIRVYAV